MFANETVEQCLFAMQFNTFIVCCALSCCEFLIISILTVFHSFLSILERSVFFRLCTLIAAELSHIAYILNVCEC